MPKRPSTQDLVVLVNERKLSMIDVCEQTGMSRQGIYKRLKAAGVHIPRSAPGGAPGKRTRRPCAFCGKTVERYNRRLVKSTQINVFCSPECYAASLDAHPYEEWRHGCRLARIIVAQHFPLHDCHIVHHKDGSQRNMDLANLLVFASQADHMAHHRGRKVQPLFDGASVKQGLRQ